MKSHRTDSFMKAAVVALTLAATVGWTPVQAQDRPHIERGQIDAMFSAMRANAPWDVNGPLLWGYFFLDPNREKLEQVASELKSKDYRIVDIDPGKRGLFKLHVEKVETHTPASLDARNQDFYVLAERFGIAYDGMDVGPAHERGGK